jgi:hypothetical protein
VTRLRLVELQGDEKFPSHVPADTPTGVVKHRLHLHARSLTFRHPVFTTPRTVHIVAPPPPHFLQTLRALGLTDAVQPSASAACSTEPVTSASGPGEATVHVAGGDWQERERAVRQVWEGASTMGSRGRDSPSENDAFPEDDEQ